MTNAFYVALTFKLRTLGSRDRAAADKAAEDSPWEHLGVSPEDLGKAVGQVVGDADIDVLLPFAQRLWNEPVWEFKLAGLKALALGHVGASDALWAFVCDSVKQLDGPTLSGALAEVAAKCLVDTEARLEEVEASAKSRHPWVRGTALAATLPWAAEGRDPERMLGWAADLAGDQAPAVQGAIGDWLRALADHDATRRNAFLAEHGETLSAEARREAEK